MRPQEPSCSLSLSFCGSHCPGQLSITCSRHEPLAALMGLGPQHPAQMWVESETCVEGQREGPLGSPWCAPGPVLRRAGD